MHARLAGRPGITCPRPVRFAKEARGKASGITISNFWVRMAAAPVRVMMAVMLTGGVMVMASPAASVESVEIALAVNEPLAPLTALQQTNTHGPQELLAAVSGLLEVCGKYLAESEERDGSPLAGRSACGTVVEDWLRRDSAGREGARGRGGPRVQGPAGHEVTGSADHLSTAVHFQPSRRQLEEDSGPPSPPVAGCVDDPSGMLSKLGGCGAAVPLGCATDLHSVDTTAPVGSVVSLICPLSCDAEACIEGGLEEDSGCVEDSVCIEIQPGRIDCVALVPGTGLLVSDYCPCSCGGDNCTGLELPAGGDFGTCDRHGTLPHDSRCLASCSGDSQTLPKACWNGTIASPRACCNAGSSWDGEHGSACVACRAGMFDGDSDPFTACEICPAGTFSATSASTACTSCGVFGSLAGSTSCSTILLHNFNGVSGGHVRIELPPPPTPVPGCVDDPGGMLSTLGGSCGEAVPLGCATDLHSVNPAAPVGSVVSLICPLSCDAEACNSTNEEPVENAGGVTIEGGLFSSLRDSDGGAIMMSSGANATLNTTQFIENAAQYVSWRRHGAPPSHMITTTCDSECTPHFALQK